MAPTNHASGNCHPRMPEIKSSTSPTKAAMRPSASTRQTGRLWRAWADAPSMMAAAVASRTACRISTVPRSIGTDGRSGSHAGRRMATEPAQIRAVRTRVRDRDDFRRLFRVAPCTGCFGNVDTDRLQGRSECIRRSLWTGRNELAACGIACGSFVFRERGRVFPDLFSS